MTSIDDAARAAAAEVNEVLSGLQRRAFTITKFARHADGYFHARVTINGQPLYVHCRYGSWLVPGTFNGRSMMKEPEGVLGGVLGREVKFALAEKARLFVQRENRERGGKNGGPKAAPDAGGDNTPAGDDGV